MCRIYSVFIVLYYVAQLVELKPNFKPVQMPKDCAGKNYCTERNNDYPEAIIESLLSEFNGMWKEVANKTILGKRWGSKSDKMCKYIPVEEPIHVMVDSEGNLRYVVQSEIRFNQIISMEECERPGPIAGTFTIKEMNKHEFECKQKSIDYKFLVLSLDGTKLETVGMNNSVPVCCSCVLKKRAQI